MKSYSCFFNGPYLGGAERSFALQCRDLASLNPDLSIRFYIPYLHSIDETLALKNFILECGFRSTDIFYYHYSPTLYGASRSSGIRNFFALIQMIFGLLFTVKQLSVLKIQDSQCWWVGGNKVGFVLFLYGILNSFKGRFLWHFRDYPFAAGIFKILPFLFKFPYSFTIEALGNSHDVRAAILKSPYPFKRVTTLYNPVQKFKLREVNDGKLTLGVASMLAPWKGVHSIVLFCLLYEKELRSLGYEKLSVYGDDIYKTKGDHLNYKDSLIKLVQRSGSSFIHFKGLEEPEKIFKNVDVFIHSSLKPEPFGRVILEAFEAGSVVVSTGLGGAGELINPEKDSLRYLPYDNEGLFRCLEKASQEERFKYIENAKKRAHEIKSIYQDQLREVFNLSKA